MNYRELAIVLIYLGKDVPKYVILNANRIAEIFDFDVYLFTDSFAALPDTVNINQKLKVRAIEKSSNELESKLSHDRRFREGFWLHTFHRLLLLKRIHQDLGTNKRILHVEADMLIMPSFPFESALRENLKWCRYDQGSDVASLVYLPSFSESEWLHDKVIEELDKDSYVTDMSVLRRIRQQYPARIEVFNDIFSNSEQEQHDDIFDGLGLGMWICGTDPRNTYGAQLIHENSDYKPDGDKTLGDLLSKVEFSVENGKITCDINGQLKFIHSLHIHSKDEKLFYYQNIEDLEKYLVLARNRLVILMSFRLSILRGLLGENYRRKTLLPYCKLFIKFLFKREESGKHRLSLIFKSLLRRDESFHA